jgi:hypothetical protein
MIITVEDLRKFGACPPAIEWLAENYPNGAEITAETLSAVPYKKWLIFLAGKMNPGLGYTWAGLTCRYISSLCPALEPFADRVTPDNCSTVKSIIDGINAVAVIDSIFNNNNVLIADALVKALDNALGAVSTAIDAALAGNAWGASFAVRRAAYDVALINCAVDGVGNAHALSLASWTEMADISAQYLLSM